MKRKRTPKLTTAELLAAGHVTAAEDLRDRLTVSIVTRRGYGFHRANRIPEHRRYYTP